MNGLNTLEDFVDWALPRVINNGLSERAYVTHPDFESLYVRITRRYFDLSRWECLTLAKAEAKVRGKGALKRLIKQIQEKYPHIVIYAESVLNPKLPDGLRRMGFKDDPNHPGSFYLLPANDGFTYETRP